VKWEFELGRYPQTEDGHLRLIPQSVLEAFESLSTSKEEIADVYPRLHELVLKAPFQAPEDVQLRRGDRVTVEGTIGDFAFQGSSKYPSPAFSGAVTIYHQIHVFDRSKKAPHPVFWIGLDNATITLDRANRVAMQIANLKRPLAVYKLDIGTYPSTKQGLKALVQEPADGKTAKPWGGPYLKELPTDPWGNEFEYEFRGTRDGRTEPIIWSRGPDGTNNTDDDIKSQ
jgi:type II secretion system protein G